jgi:hypothetical protein
MLIQDLEYLEAISDADGSSLIVGGKAKTAVSSFSRKTTVASPAKAKASALSSVTPSVTITGFKTESSVFSLLGSIAATTGSISITSIGITRAEAAAGITGGIAMSPLGIALSSIPGAVGVAF